MDARRARTLDRSVLVVDTSPTWLTSGSDRMRSSAVSALSYPEANGIPAAGYNDIALISEMPPQGTTTGATQWT